MGETRLTLPRIMTSAMELVDAAGLDSLTLSAVASDLGVGPSALYGYVDGLDGLRYLIAVEATHKLTADVRNAAVGTAGDHALSEMAAAYRGFALGHPGQFASTLLPPRSDQDALAVANRDLTDVFGLVYTAMGLDEADARLAARSTRSAIHGFLALEHIGGSTPAHDREFEHLLDTLQRGTPLTAGP